MNDNKLLINIDGLNMYIFNHVKSNSFKDYLDIHKKCIEKILNSFDLFSADTLLTRKFICFLLWSCPDICAELMNDYRWKVDMDGIVKEFKTCCGIGMSTETLLLYSIVKFIGQFTTNEKYFIYSLKIVQALPDYIDRKIMSPRQLEHLFSFNKQFKPKYCLKPDKIPGSNRLIDFYENGLSVKFESQHEKYQQLRKAISQKIYEQNENINTCLYYIESSYHLFSKRTDLFDFLKKIVVPFDENKSEYLYRCAKSLFEKENNSNYVYTCPKSLIEKIDSSRNLINQFVLVKDIEQIISEKMELFDKDLNGQNHEEIIYVVKEALVVKDIFYNGNNHYHDIFRISFFKHLFGSGIIKVNDPYYTFAFNLAERLKIKWVKNYWPKKVFETTQVILSLSSHNTQTVTLECTNAQREKLGI